MLSLPKDICKAFQYLSLIIGMFIVAFVLESMFWREAQETRLNKAKLHKTSYHDKQCHHSRTSVTAQALLCVSAVSSPSIRYYSHQSFQFCQSSQGHIPWKCPWSVPWRCYNPIRMSDVFFGHWWSPRRAGHLHNGKGSVVFLNHPQSREAGEVIRT